MRKDKQEYFLTAFKDNKIICTSDGDVFSSSRGQLKRRKAPITGSGYRHIYFSINKIENNVGVHQLIYLYFNGEYSEKLTINHKNGNKLDNREINLEAITQKEQQRHAISLGLFNPRGENNPRAKLTWAKVKEIRTLLEGGASVLEVSKKYSVCDATIYLIRKKKIWRENDFSRI